MMLQLVELGSWLAEQGDVRDAHTAFHVALDLYGPLNEAPPRLSPSTPTYDAASAGRCRHCKRSVWMQVR